MTITVIVVLNANLLCGEVSGALRNAIRTSTRSRASSIALNRRLVRLLDTKICKPT